MLMQIDSHKYHETLEGILKDPSNRPTEIVGFHDHLVILDEMERRVEVFRKENGVKCKAGNGYGDWVEGAYDHVPVTGDVIISTLSRGEGTTLWEERCPILDFVRFLTLCEKADDEGWMCIRAA